MSLDGGGDNVNWSLYKQVNNKFSLIENSQTFYKNKKLLVHDTPADLYANTTKFWVLKDLGMKVKLWDFQLQEGLDI